MAVIDFEERVVAFIDILGFKNIVKSAVLNSTAKDKLQELVSLLESVVPDLNTKVDYSVHPHLIPKHNYIADCIILSAPVFDGSVANYNGLAVIVMRVIQITQLLMNHGYIVSGGISIGATWHTNNNIIGTAYQEAYLIEVDNPYPCILLSDKAAIAWKNSFYAGSDMCIYRKNCVFVNGMCNEYIAKNHQYGVIHQTYQNYRNIMQKEIKALSKSRPKRKWQWLLALLNKVESNTT